MRRDLYPNWTREMRRFAAIVDAVVENFAVVDAVVVVVVEDEYS